MPSHSTLDPRPGVGSLGAHVGPLSSPCDAAARGADRAGQLRARRYFLGLRSPSASTPPLLWSTSRPNSHPNPNPNQVPANPGLWAGDAARERAAGRAGRRATGDPRRESVPRRAREPPQAPLRPRASPQAPPTPVEELPRAEASQKSAQAPKEWPGGGDKVPPVGRPGPPRRLA